MCHNDLVKYNEPVIVDYFHLLGKSKGVKVSLKCNRCDGFYGYTKLNTLFLVSLTFLLVS